MIDKNRLQAKCSTWNIPLTGAQLDLLDRYAELLVSYNEKVNLTAITSPEGIEDRHFADSLLFAAQPEVSGRLVDVGTGAGFPGIVAKSSHTVSKGLPALISAAKRSTSSRDSAPVDRLSSTKTRAPSWLCSYSSPASSAAL